MDYYARQLAGREQWQRWNREEAADRAEQRRLLALSQGREVRPSREQARAKRQAKIDGASRREPQPVTDFAKLRAKVEKRAEKFFSAWRSSQARCSVE